MVDDDVDDNNIDDDDDDVELDDDVDDDIDEVYLLYSSICVETDNLFKCHKIVCSISYYKYKQLILTYISQMNMVVVAPSDSLSP